MNKAIGAALLVALPSLAHAQTQVPAIQANANASATAAVTSMALPDRGPFDQAAGATTVSTPPATATNSAACRVERASRDATCDPADFFCRRAVEPQRAARRGLVPPLGKPQ